MTDMTLVLPKETTKALTELTGEPRAEVALTLIIRDYARRKLAELEEALSRYESKYGMSFEAYHRKWEADKREELFGYEAEWDFLDWEGLVTRHKRLAESFAWLP